MMVTGWDYFFLKRKPNRQFRCKEIHRKHSTRVNGPKDIMAIFCVFFLYICTLYSDLKAGWML